MIYLFGILLFIGGAGWIVVYKTYEKMFFWKKICYTLFEEIADLRELHEGVRPDTLNFLVDLGNGKSFEFIISTKVIEPQENGHQL